MYSYIIGEIIDINSDGIVVENNGIGYEIATSNITMSHFQMGESYRIYTKFIVREDGIQLYGFYDLEEKAMFDLLTKVSGIGPKIAMGILSELSVRQISQAVLHSDIDVLTQAPGVGKKTASRIALELLDSIKKAGYTAEEAEIAEPVPPTDDLRVAIDALVNLGYARNEAEKAVGSIDPGMGLEELIKAALRKL